MGKQNKAEKAAAAALEKAEKAIAEAKKLAAKADKDARKHARRLQTTLEKLAQRAQERLAERNTVTTPPVKTPKAPAAAGKTKKAQSTTKSEAKPKAAAKPATASEPKKAAKPAAQQPAGDDLSALTVPALRARAKAAGLTGYSRLTKQQLIDALR